MQHFTTLEDLITYTNHPPTEHPQLYVLNLDSNKEVLECALKSSPPITTDLYSISLKRVIQGSMAYGRTKYDFQKGSMVFMAPRQVLQWDNVQVSPGGFSIYFHEDFVKGHELANTIKKYGFFDYSANEALHLSPKEEKIAESIFSNIESEYYNNQDEFSKEIILSHIDALLKYSDRFYKRQFINRKDLNSDLITRFDTALINYFEQNMIQQQGTPTVDWLAQELSVSRRYLSDSLKAETGKTAIDHINIFLIDQAKNLLLEPNSSISETAYRLGFDYPQYFSRLFKKKLGISPTQYIEENSFN